jgi:hypothetical protein
MMRKLPTVERSSRAATMPPLDRLQALRADVLPPIVPVAGVRHALANDLDVDRHRECRPARKRRRPAR